MTTSMRTSTTGANTKDISRFARLRRISAVLLLYCLLCSSSVPCTEARGRRV